MSLRRKGGGVLAANWVSLLVGLASTVVVVRFVGAGGRGTIVLLTTLVTILATLGQFGFLASATYYLRKGIYGERTLIANYLVVIAVVSALCMGLTVVGQGVFDRLFLQEAPAEDGLILLAMSMLPMIMFTNFVAALLLAKGDARTYGFLTVIPAIAGLVLTFVFVGGLDLGVTGAVVAVVASSALGMLIAGVPLLRRQSGERAELNRRTMTDLGRFGLQYYGTTVSLQIFKRGDNFLLAYFLDVKAVGYYSVGVNLYELILSLPRAVSGLVAGEAAGRSEERAGALVARATRAVVWLMATGAIVVGFASYWLIPPIYGLDFDQARVPALILLASAVALGFALNLQNYFIGVGRPALITALSFVGGIANLVLRVALIPPAGIVGNAIATLLSSFLTLALFLVWFRRLAGVPLRSTCLPPPSGVVRVFGKRGAPRLHEQGG